MYIVASSFAALFFLITVSVVEEQQKTIQKKLEEISKDNQNLEVEYNDLINNIENENLEENFDQLKQTYDQDELDIVSLEESLEKMKRKNEQLIEEYNMKKQKLDEDEKKLKAEEENFDQNNNFLKFIVNQKFYILGIFIVFVMVQIYFPLLRFLNNRKNPTSKIRPMVATGTTTTPISRTTAAPISRTTAAPKAISPKITTPTPKAISPKITTPTPKAISITTPTPTPKQNQRKALGNQALTTVTSTLPTATQKQKQKQNQKKRKATGTATGTTNLLQNDGKTPTENSSDSYLETSDSDSASEQQPSETDSDSDSQLIKDLSKAIDDNHYTIQSDDEEVMNLTRNALYNKDQRQTEQQKKQRQRRQKEQRQRRQKEQRQKLKKNNTVNNADGKAVNSKSSGALLQDIKRGRALKKTNTGDNQGKKVSGNGQPKLGSVGNASSSSQIVDNLYKKLEKRRNDIASNSDSEESSESDAFSFTGSVKTSTKPTTKPTSTKPTTKPTRQKKQNRNGKVLKKAGTPTNTGKTLIQQLKQKKENLKPVATQQNKKKDNLSNKPVTKADSDIFNVGMLNSTAVKIANKKTGDSSSDSDSDDDWDD